jgi:DnaJ-class molecular chaperone
MTAKFQKISVAYEILSDTTKRNDYNNKRRSEFEKNPNFKFQTPGTVFNSTKVRNGSTFSGGAGNDFIFSFSKNGDTLTTGSPDPSMANANANADSMIPLSLTVMNSTLTYSGGPGANSYSFPGGTGMNSSFRFTASPGSSNTFSFPSVTGKIRDLTSTAL